MSFKEHVYILGGLLLSCLVFTNPLVLTYLAILTLGFGIIVALFLVNGTFYYALTLPGILFKEKRQIWKNNTIGSFVLIFAIPILAAIVPPALSHLVARSSVYSGPYSDKEHKGGAPERAATVTLSARKHVRIDGVVRPACDILCQRILAEDLADNVVVVSRPRKSKKEATASTFGLRRLSNCPAVLHEHEKPDPQLLRRRASGECLVAWPATSLERDADGLVVDIEWMRKKEISLPCVTAMKRLSIGRRKSSETTELLNRTEITCERLAIPLHLSIATKGPHGFPSGWKFARHREITNAFDADETVLAFLKGTTAPLPRGKNQRRSKSKMKHAETTQLIERLLASPQTAAFEPSLRNVVIA